jgi:hypothetical protein
MVEFRMEKSDENLTACDDRRRQPKALIKFSVQFSILLCPTEVLSCISKRTVQVTRHAVRGQSLHGDFVSAFSRTDQIVAAFSEVIS